MMGSAFGGAQASQGMESAPGVACAQTGEVETSLGSLLAASDRLVVSADPLQAQVRAAAAACVLASDVLGVYVAICT